MARLFALFDSALGYFTVFAYGNPDECNPFEPMNVALNPCGNQFVRDVLLLYQMLAEIQRVLQIISQLLNGLGGAQ